MGQKIHPHGLRVGLHRKWSNTWFAAGSEWKNLFFYQKEVENFFKSIFYFYPYTKISKTKKILLFDVKIFKYSINKLFLFIFFYKLRTKRRKELRPKLKIKKKTLIKKYASKKHLSKKMYTWNIYNWWLKNKNYNVKNKKINKK